MAFYVFGTVLWLAGMTTILIGIRSIRSGLKLHAEAVKLRTSAQKLADAAGDDKRGLELAVYHGNRGVEAALQAYATLQHDVITDDPDVAVEKVRALQSAYGHLLDAQTRFRMLDPAQSETTPVTGRPPLVA